MSSAGRAASSSGCVGRPREQETGLTGYAAAIQHSSLTGSSVMEPAEHREPYESRGSRTDLGAPGGANPPGDSTNLRVPGEGREGPVSAKAANRRTLANWVNLLHKVVIESTFVGACAGAIRP